MTLNLAKRTAPAATNRKPTNIPAVPSSESAKGVEAPSDVISKPAAGVVVPMPFYKRDM